MKTLYVAGPMSGYPSYNFPAFCAATKSLRAVGYEVISPHEESEKIAARAGVPLGQIPWTEYMRHDLLTMIGYAEGIALLIGWTNSQGAQLEAHVATSLGMKCQLVDRWIEEA